MTSTTDAQYADLLAHLSTYPVKSPAKREQTASQELEHLVEDLIEANGEAPW